jgi:hypothetical protein
MKEEGKLENHENKDEVLEGFNSNRTYILVWCQLLGQLTLDRQSYHESNCGKCWIPAEK